MQIIHQAGCPSPWMCNCTPIVYEDVDEPMRPCVVCGKDTEHKYGMQGTCSEKCYNKHEEGLK